MDIRIFQMEVVAGDPETNFRNIVQFVNKNMDADLLVLPEMCVGGYLVGDEWNRQDFAEWVESYNEAVKNLSRPTVKNDQKPVAIVWGNIAIDHSKKNEDGRVRKYNAVWAAYDGEYIERNLLGEKFPPYQAKTLMPNYRFFDDKRYFTSYSVQIEEDYCVQKDRGAAFVPFEIHSRSDNKTYKVGLEVCEDMWYKDYNVNPTANLVNNGADFIVNVSASPWTWGKEKARANVVRSLGEELGDKMVPIYYANIVGAQNNGKNIITFDGRSSVYDSNGELSEECNQLFKQTTIKTQYPVRTDLPQTTPVANDNVTRYKEKFEAIRTGLLHIAPNGPKQKWVIGLSGGIDSCVSAAILVKTFGSDNVIGVNMPSKYNSKKTKSAAKQLANTLGMTYMVVPIDKMVNAKRKIIKKVDAWYGNRIGGENTLFDENEQARMRGMILADIAATHDALFTNNGNKDEAAQGYASLYGDICGAVAPLADLTKEEVYGMARFLNDYGYEYHAGSGPNYNLHYVIPEEAILNENFDLEGKIAPSAELKEDQTDPLKFGFLCKLIEHGIMDYKKVGIDTILKAWIEGTLIEDFDIDKDLFYKYGLHEALTFEREIKGIFRKLKGSTFKRVQFPPIIVTSKSAFGYDYRESILPHKYGWETIDLFNKILEKKYY